MINVRDPERIDRILLKLGEIWRIVPDMRLCQLTEIILNYEIGNVATKRLSFHISDDYLEAQLDKYLEDRNLYIGKRLLELSDKNDHTT